MTVTGSPKGYPGRIGGWRFVLSGAVEHFSYSVTLLKSQSNLASPFTDLENKLFRSGNGSSVFPLCLFLSSEMFFPSGTYLWCIEAETGLLLGNPRFWGSWLSTSILHFQCKNHELVGESFLTLDTEKIREEGIADREVL